MNNHKEYLNLFSPELANIFEDISQIHTDVGGGSEVYYLPQTLYDDNNKNILDEVKTRTYENIFNLKIVPENKDSLTTNNDVYNSYGFDLDNEATFYISQREYKSRILEADKDAFTDNEARTESIYKPMVGDIFWLPIKQVFLEVKSTRDEEELFFGYRGWWTITCTEYLGRKSDIINIDIQTGDDIEIENAINKINDIIDSIDNEYKTDIDTTQTGFDPLDTKGINDDIEEVSSDNKDSNSINDIFGEF